MRNLKKYITIFTVFCVMSVLASSSLSADEFLGMNAVHGDPTIPDSGISLFSASDLARYYPNGSYFSVNRKACECHVVNHTPSDSCNCGRYVYYANGYNMDQGAYKSYQCDGFSRLCFHEYNGMDVPYNKTNESSYVSLTKSNLETILSTVGTQSHFRGSTKTASGKYVTHSVFVVGYNSETITIWQANYGGNCLIKNQTVTYDEFITILPRLHWAYSSDGTIYDSSKGTL